MKRLKDCEYSAFISYAHADDTLCYRWVTSFRIELEQALRAQLRGVPLPRMHLSGDNGPVSGRLSDELQRRIEASFAMIIVVHENYAQSTWCLKELEVFKQLFGEEGVQQRLYIVALSESPMLAVSGGRAWQQLMPGGEQLWLPFFDATDPTRPLDVYMDKGLVSNAFRLPFERLRNDFAAKLKKSAALGLGLGQEPGAALPVAGPPPAAVDVVLPGLTAMPGTASSPAAPTPGPTLAAPLWLGFVPSSAAPALDAVALRLQQAGVAHRRLSADAVFNDFAELDGVQRLVLAFDDSPPMMAGLKPGGHLELQRDAWLKRGRSLDALSWLDLRSLMPMPMPRPGPGPSDTADLSPSAAYVKQLGVAALGIDALLDSLRGPAPAASPLGVRIYIESNRHERTLWEPLGEQIQRKWDDMFRNLQPAQVPPLTLRARGLPVDQLDSFPSLDDADGVVLLWGKKTSDALVAQIDKVEKKTTPGRDAPPGIVAYLMPPQQSSEPMPAWGWQVLRFDARDEDHIDVLDEERDQLKRFLKKVLQRRRLREGTLS